LVEVDTAAPARDVAAAEGLARRAHAALAATADPAATLAEWMATGEFEGRAVLIEDVPAVSADQPGWAPEYLGALYGLRGLGLVDGVVRSRDFGFHVIVITEVVPARNVSIEDAAAEIRAEIVRRRRAEALEALLERLADDNPVEPDHAAIERAVTRELFADRSGP
jgi:hypothetical protein